ncbi:uncharacterized protein CCR75_006194 [Bremia lactucae]|uniref:WDR19 first beta-propeller domain-containing protein n=1 Tax=Bremia lactucae TaxID=4779 RepID=A0A976FGT6_BRELC|nr:hypothetical protein CCR75_006194 [Bremia lactucae]
MLITFSVDARHHGVGPVRYAWDPRDSYVASTGASRVVHIFSRRGKLVDQIVPPSPSMCTLLEWSVSGSILAIVQANSSSLVLWEPTKIEQHQLVELPCKDISYLKWSTSPNSLMVNLFLSGKLLRNSHLAVVWCCNSLLLARLEAKFTFMTTLKVASKHKRRILCGDWNLENKFAFGSEDRQITICLPSGETIDQVKIKASPRSITFGGKKGNKNSILSVNMGGKTILLYDLTERENALELAFQARYGKIVSYQWFGHGYIVAGFSSGYVVIISTHLKHIGQEQYCVKFHEQSLREIVYNEANEVVATCGDNCIKVVRMSDWKEIAVEYLDSDASALTSNIVPSSMSSSSALGDPSSSGTCPMQVPSMTFEDLEWTRDGRILSISSQNGCLHNFIILNSVLQTSFFHPKSPFAALLKPIAPWTLVFTIVFMVVAILLVISLRFNVSCWDVIRAMTGFIEVL